MVHTFKRLYLGIVFLFALTGAVNAGQSMPGFVPLTIMTKAGQSFVFQVEEALTPEQQSQGLMYRQTMAEFSGMIFVFDEPRPVTFWMRNTILSLDLLFIATDPKSGEGVITGIFENAVPFSEDLISSPGAVRAVLEIRGGMAARLGIKPGDRVTHHLLDGN